MKINIAFTAIITIVLFIFIIAGSEIAQGASNNFRVAVLIIPSKNFKSKYKSDYYTETYRGSTRVYDLQDDLINELMQQLTSSHSGGTLNAVFCKTGKEMDEKMGETDVYFGVRVEIDEYKRVYEESSNHYISYSELSASCEILRKSGMAWAKVFSRKLTAKSTKTNDEEYYTTPIERMAGYLDNALTNQMVLFQITGSVSKDIRTKEIKVKVMNPCPLPIRCIKWTIPMEKNDLTVSTEGLISPGETTDVVINVRAEKSHAAIQWRNLYVSGIEFGSSGK